MKNIAPGNRLKVNKFSLIFLILVLVLTNRTGNSQDSVSYYVPTKKIEKHHFGFGVGFGLDYGGLLGIQLQYMPISNLSIMAAGGYYFVAAGWQTGMVWNILPATSKYLIRPKLKIMYGTNGVTMVTGKEEYDRIFTGFTPGIGVEFRFGRKKRNGLDIDINYPIHHPNFEKQIEIMENDPEVTGVKRPWKIAISIGYHLEL